MVKPWKHGPGASLETRRIPGGKPGESQVFPWDLPGKPVGWHHFGEIPENSRLRKTACTVGKITFLLVKPRTHIFEVPGAVG